MASPTKINVYKDQRFQCLIRVPGSNGLPRKATAGEVPGVTARLAAAENGPAIDAIVGNLAATENSGDPAIQYVDVDTSLLQTWLLPLLVGTSFWVIYSKPGAFNMVNKEFIVSDRDTL